MRVLVVEDEKSLAYAIATILSKSSFEVDIAYDGLLALDYLKNDIYDAMVLDVMMPKLNGFEVLKQIRNANNHIPVCMLTAKSQLEDRVYGLNHGADYYLTKPFENDELVAAVKAIARRQYPLQSNVLTFGDLTLDIDASTLSVNDNQLPLNPKECSLLSLLITNQNHYVSKEMILSKIWGLGSDAMDNNVEAYVSFLRKKLTLLNSNVKLAVLRKVGYRLEIDS